MAKSDTLTILESTSGAVLAKSFGDTVAALPVRPGRLFYVTTRAIVGLRDLSSVLTSLETDRHSAVIRGQLGPGLDPSAIKREAANFDDLPRRWICLDIDDLDLPSDLTDFNSDPDRVIRYARSRLPIAFQSAGCHWQFSASMGIMAGKIKLHMWFWLSRAVTSSEARKWLEDAATKIDLSLYNSVQLHFTAKPLFFGSLKDPVSTRSGLLRSSSSTVKVPAQFANTIRSSTPLPKTPDHRLDQPEIVRNANGKVIDGREKLMFSISLDVIAQLTNADGSHPPTIKELTEEIWQRFSGEADLTDGKWLFSHAQTKAEDRLADLEAGTTFHGRGTVLWPGQPPTYNIQPRSVSDARNVVQTDVLSFFDDVIQGEQKCLVLRITMGVGKTTATIRAIEAAFRTKPDLNVAIYVPRHDLADEIVQALSVPEYVQVVHVRGMTDSIDLSQSLCKRPEYVNRLTSARVSVRPNACFKSESEKCVFYGECPYWRQFDKVSTDYFGTVRIYAHANMKYARYETEPVPDVIIIDESFIQSIHEEVEVPLEIIRTQFLHNEVSADGDRFAAAIQSGQPILKVLRELRVDEPWLMARDFTTEDGILAFDGQSSFGQMIRIPPRRAHTRAKTVMRDVIVEELRLENRSECERVRYNRLTGNLVINRLVRPDFPVDASLLILDATADRSLLEHVLGIHGSLDFKRVDAKQNARVSQCHDRTGSNAFWETDWDSDKYHYFRLICLLKEQVRGGRIPLVVSHKALADRLRKENLPPQIHIEHFGNLRGTNAYQECDYILITGRNQPPQHAVDGLARAIWWDDATPLFHDEAASFESTASIQLPLERRGYLFTDRTELAGVDVRTFTDDRVESVHAQIRETETVQALARIRAVNAIEQKHVVMLSNLPVEAEIDDIFKWDDLMPDKAEMELIETGNFPISSSNLRKMRPDLAVSPAQADNILRRSRIAKVERLPFATTFSRAMMVEMSFRQMRNGKPFGVKHKHLFRPDYRPPTPGNPNQAIRYRFDEWQALLEKGDQNRESTGWGPVEMEIETGWATPSEITGGKSDEA